MSRSTAFRVAGASNYGTANWLSRLLKPRPTLVRTPHHRPVTRRRRRQLVLEGLEDRALMANLAPVDLTLAGGKVLENSATGTEVGTLVAIDPNSGDTFTYSLVAGQGGTDNSQFTIQGDKLVAQGPFDYESRNHLHVRMRATDQGGLFVERAFTVTVLDQDDTIPPSSIQVVSQSEPENYVELGARVDTLNPQSVSDDGRYYVFSSIARNLVPDQVDRTNNSDVYLYDRTDDSIRLVSHGVDSFAASGDGESRNARISGDGRFVAFESTATNLVVGQSSSDQNQVYLYDVATGAISLISAASTAPTTPGNGATGLSGISDDGNRIVVISAATNFLASQSDANSGTDVFVYDRPSKQLSLASHSTAGSNVAANARSIAAQISGDGQWVVFTSLATNLATGITDTNNQDDVWLYNVGTTQLTLVSHSASAAASAAGSGSFLPVISDNGQRIAYESLATNLVTGQSDSNSARDIFLYDRLSNSSLLASHATGSITTASNGSSTGAALSGDGNFLAYQSTGNNLTPGLSGTKTRTTDDVFLYSSGDGLTTLVSHTSNDPNLAGNGRSWQPSISNSGEYVAYLTLATNVVGSANDTNGSTGTDAILYSLVADSAGLIDHLSIDPLATADAAADSVIVSGGGDYVFFTSLGSNLLDTIIDNQGTRDAFVYDVTTGLVDSANRSDLLSPATTSTGGGGNQYSAYASSDDDRYWVFTSTGVDLMPNTIGAQPVLGAGTNEIYLFDRFTFSRTLVSHAASSLSTVPNGSSSTPLISANGNYVVFQSAATNLVTGQTDSNTAGDVFLYDVATGSIVLVSHKNSSTTTTGNGAARPLAISQDGQYVLFASAATDVITNQIDVNSGDDLFLYNRLTGTSVLVSHVSGQSQATANQPTGNASMTLDGSLIALSTKATNLTTVASGQQSSDNVYLYTASSGTSALVSHSTTGANTAGNGASTSPRISKLGDAVVFLSTATNLVSGQVDTNGGNDAFVYDVAAGTLNLVSHAAASSTQAGNGTVSDAVISGDGLFIAYAGTSTDAVTGQTDSNGAADVFLYDVLFDDAVLVSHRPGNDTVTGTGGVGTLAIGDDGRYVAFESTGQLLVGSVPGAAGSREIYQYDSANDLIRLVTERPTENLVNTARLTGLGATGEWIGLTSDSDLQDIWDYNFLGDFFLWSTPSDLPNSPPTDLGLSGTSVHESLPIGTAVGQISTVDPDSGDTFDYSLVAGPGGDDNASFRINGNTLETNEVFQRSVKSSYLIRLRSTDAAGTWVEKAFVIAISGDNVAPSDITLSRLALYENLRGATVGTVTVVDPDAGDTHTLSVSDSRFTFVGNKLKLLTTQFLKQASEPTVTLTITAKDSAVPPNQFSKQFVLTVLANPTPWRNPDPHLTLDVNPDTFIVPQDALVVINELNAAGPHDLLPPIEGEAPPPPYYDTNGDNNISPIDALLVINYLNSISGAEGEGNSDAALSAIWASNSDGSGDAGSLAVPITTNGATAIAGAGSIARSVDQTLEPATALGFPTEPLATASLADPLADDLLDTLALDHLHG